MSAVMQSYDAPVFDNYVTGETLVHAFKIDEPIEDQSFRVIAYPAKKTVKGLGIGKKYANPLLIPSEKEALSNVMRERYAIS